MNRRRGLLTELVSRLFGGGRAEPQPPSLHALDQYRRAVEIVWADGKLSEAKLKWLGVLERELDLSQEEATGVEREVTGRAKEEIVVRTVGAEEEAVPGVDGMDLYRVAVEVAWADKELSGAEKDRLVRLEGELGLVRERAAGVEHEVMGGTREEIAPPEDKVVYRVGPMAQYRTAVEMAWADGKLNKAEEKRLGALELDLGISGGQAEEIEREVMGGTREEVVSIDPEPTPTPTPEPLEDERWIELIDDCVEVVEELDRHMERFDPARQELADHVVWRLAEVLERSGVELISNDETLDSKRHEAVKAGSRATPGAPIVETLSPGFAVGRRVLRRARVRLE